MISGLRDLAIRLFSYALLRNKLCALPLDPMVVGPCTSRCDGSRLINQIIEILARRFGDPDFGNLNFQTALPPKLTTYNGCDSS